MKHTQLNSDFTQEELLKIKQHRYNFIIDNTIKQRLEHLEKLQPFKKISHKTKKNKQFRKFNNTKNVLINYKTDPYKFKQIPSNIKDIISTLLDENNIHLQTLAFKLKIPLYKLDLFLNKNGLLDNYDLHKLLKFFNYTINFNQDNYDNKNKYLTDIDDNIDDNEETEYI